MGQMEAYFQFFSTMKETEELGENHCAVRVFKTSPTNALGKYRTQVERVSMLPLTQLCPLNLIVNNQNYFAPGSYDLF